MKALEKYIKSQKPKDLVHKFQKLAREHVGYLPEASFTSIETTKIVFESNVKQTLCEYHRKGKSTTFIPDTVIQLHGAGFKGRSVSKAEDVVAAKEGHLNCGCPVKEVALEFFLWKTTRAFSSNPALTKSYPMEDLQKLKPSTRVFWNKSLRDYTGLLTEDFIAPDYGSPTYATRIALIQLHTQIERLKALKVPMAIQVMFPDAEIADVPQDLIQYGKETGVYLTGQQLLQDWNHITTRVVFPLPFVRTSRKED